MPLPDFVRDGGFLNSPADAHVKVVVENSMQSGYSYIHEYRIGDLLDRFDFFPDLSPPEMLALGIFGGKYFNDVVDTCEYPYSLVDICKDGRAR